LVPLQASANIFRLEDSRQKWFQIGIDPNLGKKKPRAREARGILKFPAYCFAAVPHSPPPQQPSSVHSSPQHPPSSEQQSQFSQVQSSQVPSSHASQEQSQSLQPSSQQPSSTAEAAEPWWPWPWWACPAVLAKEDSGNQRNAASIMRRVIDSSLGFGVQQAMACFSYVSVFYFVTSVPPQRTITLVKLRS
jgi:hypothetical protein